ncbi:MAG: VacJ family lipoprotein [Oleispira sp.]|nr:VacJ family lipoprotein [Oleispira sp.]
MKLKGFYFALLLVLSTEVVLASDIDDPWEGMNRSIFEFNEGLDAYIAKPVAQGYQAVTPQVVDTGVSNFFSNLEDVLIVFNDLLQLKPVQAASDTSRFVVNTTLGLLGLFDVASHIGLPKHNEDLGQTLGYWGVSAGPYIMLPVLGPSNLRDTFGLAGDTVTGLGYTAIGETTMQSFGLWSLRNVDVRADLISSEGLITGERYTFFRSFYQQRREYLVNDGVVEDDFDDDFDDDFEDDDFEND